MNKPRLIALSLAIGVLLGGAAGVLLGPRTVPTQSGPAAAAPLFYRHPMNPAITSPVPAKDEMGMDYVPVYADAAPAPESPGTVKIDPVTLQNIGVRTVRAERSAIGHDVRTVGRVDYAEDGLTRVFPKVDGWVERLHVKRTGDAVRKGAPLLSLYSPELVTTQEEYLLALDNREALGESGFEIIRRGAAELARATRSRLALLGVPEDAILRLEKTRKAEHAVSIRSPYSGVVTHIGVRDGERVMRETELFRIADLRQVWVYADVYENELPWVGEGDAAEIRSAALPGRVLRGEVTAVYPYLDASTRTARLRVELDNRDGMLRPDMYVDVVLSTNRKMDAVVVPREAIIHSGRRELVFVTTAPGRFAPREVRVGVRGGETVQILDGLEAGEEVVVSAQFLIDSESRLREAAAKMLDVAGGHAHEPKGTDAEAGP